MELNKSIIAILVAISCLVFAGLSNQLLYSSFGETLSYPYLKITVITALSAAAVAWVAAHLMDEERNTTALATATLSMGALLMINVYQTERPIARDSAVAAQARAVAAAGASNIGVSTPLQEKILEATASWDDMKTNRELVKEVASGSADPTQVMIYLKTARKWNVDATSVASNGLVRAQDRRILFQHHAAAQDPNALAVFK